MHPKIALSGGLPFDFMIFSFVILSTLMTSKLLTDFIVVLKFAMGVNVLGVDRYIDVHNDRSKAKFLDMLLVSPADKHRRANVESRATTPDFAELSSSTPD